MIENTTTLKEIRDFLSSGSSFAHQIEELTMKGRFWSEGITHSQIKDKCAEILYFHNWNPKINLEDTKLLLEGQVYKTCSKCSGMGRIYLWE